MVDGFFYSVRGNSFDRTDTGFISKNWPPENKCTCHDVSLPKEKTVRQNDKHKQGKYGVFQVSCKKSKVNNGNQYAQIRSQHQYSDTQADQRMRLDCTVEKLVKAGSYKVEIIGACYGKSGRQAVGLDPIPGSAGDD